MRKAGADEAEDVLVEEVEIGEAVDVADGGMIADWIALIGIGDACEDVPGCGDEKKEEDTCNGLEFTPATPLTAQKQERNSGGEKEDRGDEALGESGKSEGGPHSVEADGAATLQAGDEGVESEKKQKSEDGLRDEKARVEKRAYCSDDLRGRRRDLRACPRRGQPTASQSRRNRGWRARLAGG